MNIRQRIITAHLTTIEPKWDRASVFKWKEAPVISVELYDISDELILEVGWNFRMYNKVVNVIEEFDTVELIQMWINETTLKEPKVMDVEIYDIGLMCYAAKRYMY